jgi:hypothetical protein
MEEEEHDGEEVKLSRREETWMDEVMTAISPSLPLLSNTLEST